MKEIENATRLNVYSKHKYIEHLPIKPSTISLRDRQAYTQIFAIEFSRR